MKRLIPLLTICSAAPAVAQNLDPRSFVNTPVGINFAVLTYGYQTGNVLVDPSLPVEDGELTIQGPTASFARALDLWGMSGKVDASLGWACADGHAVLGGAIDTSRHVCGVADPTAHISLNFIGAPAMTLRQYPAYKQDLLVGAGFRMTAPLSQYDPTKFVNIGTNRWSFKPEIGVSKAAGRLTMEFLGAVTFYTTNTDFFDGSTKSQAPLYSAQVNVVYTFRSGIWGAAGVIFYGGGATTVDAGEPINQQENSRAGATLVFPIGRHNSFKVYWTTGVSTRTGTDFQTYQAGWTYLWGGKP